VRIVIADDDALSRRLTQHTLERAGYDVVAVENGCLAAKYLFRAESPRLALLDWVMPELDGPGVCRAIRARTTQPYIYIILLTSKESKEDLVAGLEAGADDFLTKPGNTEELKARLRTGQRILQLHDRLFHDARHDALTQLPNRSYFLDRLSQCVRRSRENPDYNFAVLFVDLDRFKIVNDSLGHAAGDELIARVAERLRGSIRREPISHGFNRTTSVAPSDDMLARLGGDEFTVLLDGIGDAAAAVKIAGRIRNALALPFAIAGNIVRIAASVGVSISATGYSKAENVLRDADTAMYRAKIAGRIVVSGETGQLLM